MDDIMSNEIPVKEQNHVNEERVAVQRRRMVSKYDRKELEDLYLQMHDDNIQLKKHARKQEDKIKRMATKLLRLANDQKKASKSGQPLVGSVFEERIEDLQHKLKEAEKLNVQLKDKLVVQRQALATVKRPVSYGNVTSRINTGRKVTLAVDDDYRTKKPKTSGLKRVATAQLPKPKVKQEDNQRELYIGQLEEQLQAHKDEILTLNDEMQQKEEELREMELHLKKKLTSEQRLSVQENIDVIRLQRDLKEKASKLSDLQEKYMLLDENLRAVKLSNDTLLIEMEQLNRQLKSEQNHVLALHGQLKSSNSSDRRIYELQEHVRDLKKENEILSEANEKLVSSAFDMDREREWRLKESLLKAQIAQLEATLKADLGEKGIIIDKLTAQRLDHDDQDREYRDTKAKYLEMKQKYDDVIEKMKYFSKDGDVDFREIEEALVLIRERKQPQQSPPDFLVKVEDDKHTDYDKRLLEVQVEYAETIQELEKTRHLLIMQHKINKDYQKEVQMTVDKMEDMKKEYNTQLDEYAHLLDIRAARIKKLESQLRDIAYGTRQYKIPPMVDAEDEDALKGETIKLERGENLFEIHISQVILTEDGMQSVDDTEPTLFCTWEFFEFEVQSTSIIRSARPKFDFTSQYVVKVDDFFLHYLQKESCTVELHQAFGQEYQTIAAGQMNFRDLFDKPQGRIHGNIILTGVRDEDAGLGIGSLDFWARLKVPMDQAFRRYKERTKALGYMTMNEAQTSKMLEKLEETSAGRSSEFINELHITINRCRGLTARRPDIQPSPYCIYQFFDFKDHDTVIVHNSNNPEFNDHRSFPVPMNSELDNYLKKKPLKIFVFDDSDPEESMYLGVADVALIPLSHDQSIIGSFQLIQQDGCFNGTIDVSVSWRDSYTPPSSIVCSSRAQIDVASEKKEMEKADKDETHRPHVKPKASARGGRKPLAMSTPAIKSEISDIQEEIRIGKVSKPRRGVSRKLKLPPQDRIAPMSDHITAADGSTSLEAPTNVVQDGSKAMDIDVPTEDKMKSESASSPESIVDEVSNQDQVAEVSEEISPEPSSIKDDKDQEAELTDNAYEDTMFEEEISSELDKDEELDHGAGGDNTNMVHPPLITTESDSEGVVVETNPVNLTLVPGNNVMITISHLTFTPDAAVMKDLSADQLYVEYRFLDIPLEETETPFALPKPRTPEESLHFNFSCTFPVDLERHYQRRQLLASMLLPDDPAQGKIQMTVVSEPPEDDEEAECYEVGVAQVDLKNILTMKRDIIEEDIPVYDSSDLSKVAGYMNVTVCCLETLIAIESEMQIENTFG